ncbi:MAG TPA: hypothetical protein PK711_01645 [Bacteroidales bacterium]|nr:hypothetical protein [Bacteroidales bacterium]HRZ20043.1 hypothetical protein [Bacteroidales bacterium]
MKTMKTFFLAALFMTGFIVNADVQPAKFTLADEPYIDDIPFNTEEIAGSVQSSSDLTQFTLEDETYIDDIPFDTEAIAQAAQEKESYEKAMAEVFTLKEEKYVNDIPFATDEIALNAAPVNESSRQAVTKVAIEPLVTVGRPVVSILEILIPVIIILGTLSYAVYEYILN